MENTVMIPRGPLVILFIFGVSAAMAGFAVWTHYQQGRQCLEFWGSESANLIRHAPQVEFLELAPREKDSARDSISISLDGRTFEVTRRLDVSQSPGLVHARHALIVDAGYEWPAADAQADSVAWKSAIRFKDGERSVTVLLDFSGRKLKAADKPTTLTMTPQLAESERKYMAMLFAADAAAQRK